MAWKPSIALRNAMLEGASFKHLMSNCVLKIYTGSQPATAEAAPTGTLLCTFSDASGALTREVQSTGSVALTAGAGGSVTSITVNSIEILNATVPYNTSLTQTAADLCTAINNNPQNYLFTAANNASATVTLKAKPGLGARPNTWGVTTTLSTMSKTDTAFASGVTAVNGLNWGDSAAGVIVKLPTQTWSGVAAATGTAGWFRIEAAVSDAGALDSSEAILRCDGSIATSGAELNMATTAIVSGVTQTITSFAVTFPTA